MSNTSASNPTARRDTNVDPATLDSLRPYVFDLWDGRFSKDGVFQSDESDVERVFADAIPKRLSSLAAGEVLPIVLYAHGGLVAETAGLQIAANQVPWWNANGCYPLQFVWETGLFESLEKIIGVQRALSRDVSDLSDAIIEGAARRLGGPEIWGNMKNAAAAAFEPGAAGTIVLERLVALVQAHPDQVRLHAVGHSAGSIFHAHLLRRLDAMDAPALETLTFMAPAITVDAYVRLVDPLVPKRAKRLHIVTMKREYELRDTVTPLYRKSLLYLIRGALEPHASEPVLGLEECLRADPQLVERFGLAAAPSKVGSIVWSVTDEKSGANASASISHGGFDNDVLTMNGVARTILGIPDATALPQSFPPDTEERAVASTFVAPPAVSARPSARLPRPLLPGSVPTRRALCVGINAYPAPNALGGCVADSEAWAAALSGLGFAVDKLQDAGASHANILARLRTMVDSSRAGDILVFQYAGHGTQVVDLDGDEPTVDGHPGNDQAICPVDFETGDLIIDDDIRAVLDRLPADVKMTCFLDSCHSATATRFLVGRQSLQTNSIPRYVHLSQDVVGRYIAKRDSVNRARALAGGRTVAGTREEMRWVLFAACGRDESAWESQGHGDFTRLAVPLLDPGAGLTNRAFQDRVLKAFGSNRRQTPSLDCRDEDEISPFLIDPGTRAPGGPGSSVNDGQVLAGSDTFSAAAEAVPSGDRAKDVADVLAAIARLLR